MKKFICILFLITLSAGLFAYNYYVTKTKSEGIQKIHFAEDTYKTYAIFVIENDTPVYAIEFYSRSNDKLAKQKAENCYEMIESFLSLHKNDFSNVLVSDITLYFGNIGKISFEKGSTIKSYIEFE